MSVVAVDRDSASVVTALEEAHRFLSTAVEMTGAAEVALIKTKIAMAETYSRELHLSKEIQTQAQEMVRRAEWALEQAIKRDREAGLIKGQQSGGGTTVAGMRGSLPRSEADRDDRPRARDFFASGEERSQVFQIGQATEQELEAALGEAKAEGNLSRANVVRKVKRQSGPTTRDQRADLIVKLANEGYSSRQMPAKVGVTEESIRQIARDYDIEIPADRYIGRTRRINSSQIVENTATALEGLVSGVDLVDYDDVDPAVADQWADSLSDSLKKLQRFATQIRKATQ